jgi:1-pyrroline-5-carboxylate dehydrogenase
VEDDRREHGKLPLLPAHRRRDRRQGLHRRAPVGRPEALAAIVRGGFEYQGQKCSAASRVYVPKSLWPEVRDRIVGDDRRDRMGDVRDFRNFMGAVIDEKAFDKISEYIERKRDDATVDPAASCDDGRGLLHPADARRDDRPAATR